MATLLPSYVDIAPFLPEVIVSITMVVVLLIPVFSPRRNGIAVAMAAGAGLLLAAIVLVRAQGMAHSGMGAEAFGGLLVMDPFAWMLKLILLVFTLFVVALWATATRDSFAPGDTPEFLTLLLGATVGMMLMVSTHNLLMMFVAIEMASLPSYVLAGFRKTHRKGAEAALKYVLFGAVSAAIMLYGMSMLYGYYGTFDLSKIAQLARQPGPFALTAHNAALVLGFPIAAILMGVFFKIAAVPMHFWCPDVFEGAHIDITAYLSVASKGAAIGMLVRILTLLTGTAGAPAVKLEWLAIGVTAAGAVTCFWGNLGALKQTNIKRLLAFSSIAHAGYMMLAVSVMMVAETSPSQSRLGEAVLFYMIGYMFLNAGAFSAAAGIAQKIGSEDIRDYAGLAKRAPVLALCMLVFVFSLTGIPLTVGFSVKLKLFVLMFQAQHPLAYAAIVVLGVNTVIAAFYYFRILKAMFLTPPPVGQESPVAGWLPTTALAAAMVVPNVGLFVAYGWMDQLAGTFAHVQGAAPEATPAGGAGIQPQAAGK